MPLWQHVHLTFPLTNYEKVTESYEYLECCQSYQVREIRLHHDYKIDKGFPSLLAHVLLA